MQALRQSDGLEWKQEFAEPSKGVRRRGVLLQHGVRQPVVWVQAAAERDLSAGGCGRGQAVRETSAPLDQEPLLLLWG